MPIPLFGRAKSKKKPSNQPTSITWLLVGLGNHGQKYAKTRHNVGFHILDRLAKKHGLQFNERRGKALIARGHINGVSVALIKPQTYMNLSGHAVTPVARFYKIPKQNILVIYDDLDLPNAQLRLRFKGGPGGHKGMKSIIQSLGTQEFPRMRIGIGRPPGRMPVEAYVLRQFKTNEWAEIKITYQTALEAITAILDHGIEYAMNNFN